MLTIPKLRFLPRTGQTVTAPTANYRAGDDGTYQAGERARSTRALELVDNGDGTCSDFATGLQWVKAPALIIPGAVGVHATNQIQRARSTWKVPPDDGLGAYVAGDLVVGDGAPDALFYVCILGHTAAADKEPPNLTYWRQTIWTASAAVLTSPATFLWNAAIDACEALEYDGFTDWRLANFMEAASLIDAAAVDPQIRAPMVHPAAGWTNTWTSTTQADDTEKAKMCRYRAAAISYADKATASYYVFPVRGGIIATTT